MSAPGGPFASGCLTELKPLIYEIIFESEGIVIAVIALVIIASKIKLWIERDYRPVSELHYPYVTDLQTIRRVTECPDFPDFEVKELWYDGQE